MRRPTPRKQGVFAASIGIEVQAAAMKEDGRLQMVPIAEAIGVFLIAWIFELNPSQVAVVIR
jgi:hypothetical protein